jgi:hypothetical protein
MRGCKDRCEHDGKHERAHYQVRHRPLLLIDEIPRPAVVLHSPPPAALPHF